MLHRTTPRSASPSPAPSPAKEQPGRLRTRGPLLTATALVAGSMCLLPAAGAFAAAGVPAPTASAFGSTAPAAISAADAALTPSEVLTSTPWETTSAVDQNGTPVALDNAAVSNYVGWAYYNPNGTFTMYNLDDTPKMQGDWEVSPDGTSRTITAKAADGTPLFTRVVPITVLTADEFTYRVIPDATAPDVYYDIVHTPTDHAEPGQDAPGSGTTEPGTTEPGTTEPGTTEPGTTEPGGTEQDTEAPDTTTPGTAAPDADATVPTATNSAGAEDAQGAKGTDTAPDALAVTGADSTAVASVVGGALAVLAGAATLVVRLVRRAA